MTDEQSFLAGIAADPDADLPRLAFADWLEEHGAADRAAFIRLQIQIANGTCIDPLAADVRVRELFAANRDEWERPFKPHATEVDFYRGLPQRIVVDLRKLLEHNMLPHGPVWTLGPMRGIPRSTDRDDDLLTACRTLRQAPGAERVTEIEFVHDGWRPHEIAAMLAPPFGGRLRGLHFFDVDDETAEPALVANAEHLASLQVLGFYGDSSEGVGNIECTLLAGAKHLAGLTDLRLPNNSITAEGATALARSRHLKALRSLDLSGGSNSTNTIGPAGAAALAGSPNFTHLTDLNLVYNRIGDEGFASLTRSKHLGRLEYLNLYGNDITDVGLIVFAASKGLKNLRFLNLCGSFQGPTFTARGVRALTAGDRLAGLTAMVLSGNPIGDDGIIALANCPSLSRLTTLYLDDCGLTIVGAEALAGSPYLTNLRELYIGGTAVSQTATAKRLRERFGPVLR